MCCVTAGGGEACSSLCCSPWHRHPVVSLGTTTLSVLEGAQAPGARATGGNVDLFQLIVRRSRTPSVGESGHNSSGLAVTAEGRAWRRLVLCVWAQCVQ